MFKRSKKVSPLSTKSTPFSNELLSLPDEILNLILIAVLCQEADITIYTLRTKKTLAHLDQLKHALMPRKECRFTPSRHDRLISTVRRYKGSVGKITPMSDDFRLDPEPTLIQIWRAHKSCSFAPRPLAVDVLYVCRRLYNIGMPILYNKNIFHLNRILNMPSFASHCPGWRYVKHLSLSGFDFIIAWARSHRDELWSFLLLLGFVSKLHSLTFCFGKESRLAIMFIEKLAPMIFRNLANRFTIKIRMTADENCNHFDPLPWLPLPVLVNNNKGAASQLPHSPVTEIEKVLTFHLLIPPGHMSETQRVFLEKSEDVTRKEWLWRQEMEPKSSSTASTLTFAAVPLTKNAGSSDE